MLPADLRLEFLNRQHDRTGFDCGAAEMNRYLQTQARQDSDKGLSRTFVLVSAEEPTVIRAFYTLTPATLEFAEVPLEKSLSRYPAPVALLAHLTVDSRFQGQRFGVLLLFDALARSEKISRQMGLYAVVLDAREEPLVPFYARFGFRHAEGSEKPRRMYLKISEIRALGLIPAPVAGE